MMKIAKAIVFAAVLAAGALFTTSCGTPFPLGCLYTQVIVPVGVGDGKLQYSREGTATCWSILGWFAGGDASLNAAAASADIHYVSWANQEVVNVLGIYGAYTTRVYGFGDVVDTSASTKASAIPPR